MDYQQIKDAVKTLEIVKGRLNIFYPPNELQMLQDGLKDKMAQGEDQHLQDQLLKRYQAVGLIEQAIQMLNTI